MTELTNPLTWDYLTRVPKGYEAYGPLAIAFLVLFGVGFVGALVLSRVLDRRFREHDLHRRLAQRATQIAAWVFGVGLTCFGFRALELPLLGMRLWLYLSALAVLVMIGLGVWYRLARYPAEKARYDQAAERQQYLRASGGGRRGRSERRVARQRR
ncbi:MAG: hypothetical protein IT340_09840 [Chloroflexi bacterium]|nr:hypothetical protein [Chloroflexota bacterium]